MTPLQKFIDQQIHARRAGHQLAPCVHPTTFAPFPVTTPYGIPGSEWEAGHHTGEDRACPVGSLAVAVTWGKVVAAGGDGAGGYGAAYGNLVVVRTGSGRYDCLFAHLSVIKVTVGQEVEPGQVVGLTGESGNVTGPHLHFETRPAGGHYGSDIDPRRVESRQP